MWFHQRRLAVIIVCSCVVFQSVSSFYIQPLRVHVHRHVLLTPPALSKHNNGVSSLQQSQILLRATETASTDKDKDSEQEANRETNKNKDENILDAKKIDFCRGYLNKHHSDLLALFVEVFSDLGIEKARRNKFSGGSYNIQKATLVDITTENLELEVQIKLRSEEPLTKMTSISLDADPVALTRSFHPTPIIQSARTQVELLVRKLNRLCNIVNRPAVTGKIIQMGMQFGSSVGEVHENMYLNQVPHNRYVRQYFYDMTAEATLEAVVACSKKQISNRMKIIANFPELNPSMDSYRIGTLLEMTRAITIRLAEQNLRVRVCVQGSMGVGIFTGVPKQLNGVSTLLQRMDWQSQEGEAYEGMLGNYVNFGHIGKEHVVDEHTDKRGNKVEQDDVFILICPQSMVGLESSIVEPLQEMVEAAGNRPVIIMNPDLTDKISAQGQQSVRGRKQRIEFAESFLPIFYFSNIYVSGTSYFPILGATTKLSLSHPWVCHQRRDLRNNDGEVYIPVLSDENKPSGETILATFEH